MATSSVARVLERVRQPEYTGENRCVPCTVTNVAIAAVGSAVVGYGAAALGAGATGGSVLGIACFAASCVAIALRGYLVPGTPTLTKRFFPDRVLAWFDKAPTDDPVVDGDADVDVEAELLGAGVFAERPDGDLALTSAFADAWREQMAAERASDRGREAVADVVDVDAEGLELQGYADGAFVAAYDGHHVGRWESEAAFIADAAAGRVLPEFYDGWDRAGPAARGQLLAGLRLFIEECPDCGGAVEFGQDVVESCCRTRDVVAVTCRACDARLFEVDATQELLGAA
ncbi:MAG: hypothetical protein ABEJ31_00915 [Haloarculaceae archaeon]